MKNKNWTLNQIAFWLKCLYPFTDNRNAFIKVVDVYGCMSADRLFICQEVEQRDPVKKL